MRYRRLRVGGILALLLIPAGSVVAATAATTGIIVDDTTWTSTDTVTVSGILIISSTARLTVEAGARIVFTSGATLVVQGEMTAEGGSSQRILFTSSADTAGGQPAAGAWGGIRFESSSQGLLRYGEICYATSAVSVSGSSPTIERCVIDHFSVAGCYIDGYDASPQIAPRIEHCIIMQTDPARIGTGDGIITYRATDVTIAGCWIRNCRDGVSLNGIGSLAPHFTITNTEIADNARYGIYTYAGG